MEVLRNCNIYCTFKGCFCMMYWSYFISSRARKLGCTEWKLSSLFTWPNEKCGGLMTKRKRKKKLMRIHFLILHIQIYQASLNLLPNLTIFTIIPNNRNKNKQLFICSTWKVFPRHLAIIFSSRLHHLSNEKKPLTFHYTRWLIGILTMVYEIIPI